MGISKIRFIPAIKVKNQILVAFLVAIVVAQIGKVHGDQGPLQIEIDARDLPRKLLESTIQIPLQISKAEQKVALWYPKWVPGSHGPGGSIENIAGLRIEAPNGDSLPWTRTPGEVYRIEVTVPANVASIKVWIRYITNQPGAGSMGHDSYGGATIGVISPNTILLYPESANVNSTQALVSLKLPQHWKASTALQVAETKTDQASQKSRESKKESRRKKKGKNTTSEPKVTIDDTEPKLQYQSVSLSEFVDSPIMCGRYQKIVELVETNPVANIPLHRLHVFTDVEKNVPIDDEIVAKLKAMVTQTALLTGSHPFDHFEILLALTDHFAPNGLEHSRSTFNVLPTNSMSSLGNLKGWNRLLIPHEYLHAWCGKYRRPSGMMSDSFHAPLDTELLWVYEGLTQYLGELVEARCGLMNQEQFIERIAVELRNATRQQGRQWQTLADTGAASHRLRSGSNSWSTLRRSQDYYMEGMLFWIEADAIIREQTQNAKSVDNFCHEFFRATGDQKNPSPYSRADLVALLKKITPFDWDGLIRRRVESFQQSFDPAVADRLGYRFELQRKPMKIAFDTFRFARGIDTYDSLGVLFSEEGVVRNLLLGSPADQAHLFPEMRVTGIGEFAWSAKRLRQAIEESEKGTPIELKILEGDEYKTIRIQYDQGPRYLNLVKKEGAKDVLADILKPRTN